MSDIIVPAQQFETPAAALAHYGKKGMRWGVRNEPGTSDSRSAAKAEIRDVSAKARSARSASARAQTPAQRKAAAKQYENDVLKKVESPEFKAAYAKATTMGKGEMAAHVVLLGPLAAVTIPAMRSYHKEMGESGYQYEIDTAYRILREMQKS